MLEQMRKPVLVRPFAEYSFLRSGNGVRPFLGADAGFGVMFGDFRTAPTMINGGVTAGVHLFATDSFSISPHANLEIIHVIPGDGLQNVTGMTISVGVRIAGWINGRPGTPTPVGEGLADPSR